MSKGNKMISMSEILKNVDFNSLPQDHKNNLHILLDRINQIRDLYGKPMIITSGYRSHDDQIRIYAQKGITDISKIPMGSCHLKAAACDVSDQNQEFQKWCLDHVSELENIGVWFEDFSKTKNWAHVQILPYASWKSGKSLWFMP
jgi:uncharacterized protein YcbK (DUF882 family)